MPHVHACPHILPQQPPQQCQHNAASYCLRIARKLYFHSSCVYSFSILLCKLFCELCFKLTCQVERCVDARHMHSTVPSSSRPAMPCQEAHGVAAACLVQNHVAPTAAPGSAAAAPPPRAAPPRLCRTRSSSSPFLPPSGCLMLLRYACWQGRRCVQGEAL